MGVPKFYRWISERYPLINQKIGKDTEFLPKFDNMYLDMNGIIHNCTHPNDEDVTDKISMKDMVLGMFSYVDRMVHIVRPQKVLVLAVDGCAPRAKMNQQRSRRFASAKDRRDALAKALREGTVTEEEAREQFDSNCITPGTKFMEEVSRHFQYFVRLKIKEDPLWRKLTVVYSGHDVPGEGEHKIMDYIRHTRMQPGYDPNTRHCLCGLDADLIMLGLASHEPHFSLLREEVDFTGGRGGKKGGSQSTKEIKKQVEQDKWELLHLSALRQYLELDFRLDLSFGYDLERIIDDWVLLVMLVGNDFLPHLPSMSIAEGGLDDLMEKYKKLLPTMQGYITADGKVHFDRLEQMIRTIAAKEAEVFRKRIAEAKKLKKRERRRRGEIEDEDEEQEDALSAPFAEQARERGLVTASSSFREKYYAEKFGVDVNSNVPQDKMVIHSLVECYMQGIQWCYLYYYQGVQSWTWFFPFHYAPLASDLVNLTSLNLQLSKGQPFTPFMQLLGCLPADSAKFLPECYRELMILNTSPLKDFYPNEFKVDMNGKRNPWEGVNLLPFIDEARLYDAVKENCPDSKLTQAERDRNSFGYDIVYKFDSSNTQNVPSSYPEAGLKDIIVCQSSARRFLLPPMERFVPNLLKGTVADGRWPGDPQLIHGVTLLSSVPARLEEAGVSVFGRPSKSESLILNIRPGSLFSLAGVAGEIGEEDSLAGALIPSLEKAQKMHKERLTVWVDYPNLREAQVLAVADEEYVFDLVEQKRKQFEFVKSVQTEVDSSNFLANASTAEERALYGNKMVGTGGLKIGDVDVMIKVRPLQRMEVDLRSGTTRQVYSDVETWVPYQLVCFNNTAPDPRFIPRKAKSVEERMPLDAKVMCLQKAGYGMVGKVVGYEQNLVKAVFDASTRQMPAFGHIVAKSVVDKYTGSHQAAKLLKIDPVVLGKIAGSVLVKGRYDIGLNLKVGRGYMIAGYCRSRSSDASKAPWSTGESATVISGLDAIERRETKDISKSSGGWEYTQRALELILTYRKKFPQVFRALAQDTSSYEYTTSEIFGPGRSGEEVLENLCKWLEQIDTFRLPLVPISSKLMCRDAILSVQQASDEWQKTAEQHNDKQVIVTLSPEVLHKYADDDESDWIRSPTCEITPQLGDRVENFGSPVVPFGLGGTVVATHASTGCVEVLFDKGFIGGTSLYGACGTNRGKLLPYTQLLNLSKSAPIEASKGKPKTSFTPVVPNNEVKEKPKTETKKPRQKKATPAPKVQKPVAKAPLVESNTNHQPQTRNTMEVADQISGLDLNDDTGDGDGDDLADYWLELQKTTKPKKKREKKQKPKPAAQPTQEATQPKLLSPRDLLQPKVNPASNPAPKKANTRAKNKGKKEATPSAVPAAPPPAPVRLLKKPAPAVQEKAPAVKEKAPDPEDEIDALLSRASKAKGKAYKPTAFSKSAPVQQQPVYGLAPNMGPYGIQPQPILFGGAPGYPPQFQQPPVPPQSGDKVNKKE
uniref:5'-3' exoribonuclease 1 n=1 Tax=Mucochytrium quahogii TaxID=96639 RepID=A0A7S2RDX7_9STRA|mmetsp:Transcript_41372/g.66448  ORF Transcript_41372/g.66448 Transcript_41372/m.66448 type:complete len:1489 (+) Transcript_41372:241-4707(+)|eukprot:CAMPEP_0203745284 /NCGR_PEP_ID=MMETSP0098-20131031/1071_1 /ASSEMBLY_ACC=CAM_ASM_000208 /TAXON_ID=96639 /ORGANISM=" , Strain NY0313808BC1" /LENGTH=1488 /DNA_ID=CAMNT_0050633023 /DNA_START=172 /DNA_END=4638 /DNA_ORIENTATION=-